MQARGLGARQQLSALKHTHGFPQLRHTPHGICLTYGPIPPSPPSPCNAHRQDRAFNLHFLKEEFDIGPEQIDALFQFAKFQFDCGNYSSASELLQVGPHGLVADGQLWGAPHTPSYNMQVEESWH